MVDLRRTVEGECAVPPIAQPEAEVTGCDQDEIARERTALKSSRSVDRRAETIAGTIRFEGSGCAVCLHDRGGNEHLLAHAIDQRLPRRLIGNEDSKDAVRVCRPRRNVGNRSVDARGHVVGRCGEQQRRQHGNHRFVEHKSPLSYRVVSRSAAASPFNGAGNC